MKQKQAQLQELKQVDPEAFAKVISGGTSHHRRAA